MSRNLQIEALKSIAVFFVIILHVSGQLLNEHFQKIDFNFWLIDLVSSFSRVVVPVFLLASGKFLLSKATDFKEFFTHRLQKILLPLLFWSILYSILSSYLIQGSLDIKLMLKGIVAGRPFYHLWYLYMLVGLYFITPFLSRYLQKQAKNQLIGISLFFVFLAMISDVIVFYFNLFIPFPFWFVSYLGYFVLGYTLDKIEINWNLKQLVYVFLFMGIAISVLNFFTIKFLHNNLYFQAASSPTVLILTLSFYLMLLKIKFTETNFFVRNSKYSFGIYLTHALILETFYRVESIMELTFNPIFEMIIFSVLVYSTSLLLSRFLFFIGVRRLIY